MSALVPVDSSTDVEAARQRLSVMRSWIESLDDVDQLASAAGQLKDAREWMRIKKVAEDLRIQAIRIECVALRRIALLGATNKLPRAYRSWARGFAQLADDEFDALMARIDRALGPKGVWALHTGESLAREQYELGRRYAQGDGPGEPVSPSETGNLIEPYDVAYSAKVIIESFATDGDAFKVTDAAERVAESLSDYIDDPVRRDPNFLEGIAEIVRGALRSEVAGVTQGLEYPKFVTYLDDQEGWVRVPWSGATLDQLKQMAAKRREQTGEMARAADRLDALVARLEVVARRRPAMTRVAQLAEAFEPELPEGEVSA